MFSRFQSFNFDHLNRTIIKMKFQVIFAGKIVYKLMKVFLFISGLKRNFFFKKKDKNCGTYLLINYII